MDPTDVIGTVSTAFAFTYCVSTMGFIVMMKVLPRMFGKDVVADAKQFETERRSEDSAALPGTAEQFLTRTSPPTSASTG